MNSTDITTKRVHVETWGCQMNTADSERMMALLATRGYSVADKAEDADLVLLNTCHIREKARHKVLSRLGVLRQLKDSKPGMTIAVAGCVAQAEGRRLLEEAPVIDILFGPGKIDDLPRLLDERQATGKKAMALGFAREEPKADMTNTSPHLENAVVSPLITTQPSAGHNEVSRYVNIQQGCNNYCTFCVVPFTRGREVSRGFEEIEQEAKALIASGAKEITVLGQNVNSYGLDLLEKGLIPATQEGPFVDLLARISKLDGLYRLRFTTSNPHDFSKPLADLFCAQPKLGRYLHLPVQSGSDRTLERMKRKVTAAEYLEKVAWLRAAVPDIALSTDLIVGFPGETEEDFEATLKLINEVRFSFVFSFKYSPRKNTPAARYKDQLPEAVKEERLARLNALQDSITREQNQNEVGKVREVLFHYESKKDPGFYYGRTDHFRLVRVKSSRSLIGELLPVKIIEGNKTALVGSLADFS